MNASRMRIYHLLNALVDRRHGVQLLTTGMGGARAASCNALTRQALAEAQR